MLLLIAQLDEAFGLSAFISDLQVRLSVAWRTLLMWSDCPHGAMVLRH